MSTVVHPATPYPTSTDVARAARVALLGVVLGVALGATDLLAQRLLGYPWANVANSPAVWGVAAVVLGACLARPAAAAVAGVCLLVSAVLAYYLIAAAVLGDDLGIAVSTTASYWYVAAVGIGALGGAAGGWSRSARPGWAIAGAVSGPALLLAEASTQNTAVLGGAGCLWLGVLVVRAGSRAGVRTAAAVLGSAALLAVVGHALYLAVGLRGPGG